MLRGMSIRQFHEWRSYADVEPFDEERADARSAQIVQAIYNVNRRRNTPPVKLKDCTLTFGAQATGQPRTAAQAKALADQSRRAMGDLIALQKQRKRKRG